MHHVRRLSSSLRRSAEDLNNSDETMRKRLEMGRAAKRRLRRRIAGFSLAVTAAAVLVFGAMRAVLVPRLTSVVAQAAAAGASGLFLALSYCGAFLAVQPDDPLATRAAPLCFAAVALFSAVPWILSAEANLSDAADGHCNSSAEEGLRDSAAFCRVDAGGILAGSALFVLTAAFLVRAAILRGSSPRDRHAAMRRVLVAYFASLVAVNLYSGIARCAFGEVAWGVLNNLVAAMGWVAATALVARPAAGARVHARLGRIGDRAGATAAAAGIAGLIGDAPDVAGVVKSARRRFRVIRLSDLTADEVRSNVPDPTLHARAIPAALGEADAFVSHSWHDDPDAKFAALATWCDAFERRTGRPPRLWFDKCCIDQGNIDENLRCLPVFLSGCAGLVLLAGETFASRLWCIMELFTFVHAGGRLEDVEVLEAHAPGGRRAVVDSFLNFDARRARCFDPKDKERMLTVIEAAFGDMQSFNELIRPLLLHFNQTRAAPVEP